MDNLINAIDKIVEGQVFKIVISNKLRLSSAALPAGLATA